MITLEAKYRDGSRCDIDVCPVVDIRDPEKHWLTRRHRLLARVALLPEVNPWILGPMISAHRCYTLAGEDAPGLAVQTSEEGDRLLDMSNLREDEKYRRREARIREWLSGKQIESRKQADACERIATRKLGSHVLRYLAENYPEMSDFILGLSISEALRTTEHYIAAAAKARKVYGLPSDSDPIQGIKSIVREETVPVIDAMTSTILKMRYSGGQRRFDEREWYKMWRTKLESNRSSLDLPQTAYPELPELL